MKVGIDGRFIQDQYHGIGRVIYEVSLALAQEQPDDHFVVFYNPVYENSRFDLNALDQHQNIFLVETALPLYSLKEQWYWLSLIQQHKLDLFHTPYLYAPYFAWCPVVLTMWDLILERFPAYTPEKQNRNIYRLLTWLSLSKSRQVTAISEATRQDTIAYYAIAPDKIQTTLLATDAKFKPTSEADKHRVKTKYDLPAHFVLTVGTRRLHKNVAALVEAFAQIADKTSAMLVLAGKADNRWPDDVAPLIERYALADRIVEPGHIAEADLPVLYGLASVLAFPSVIEGFGLPVLEAMACGTAVVTSNSSSIPEIVGDAGLMVDPHDIAGLGQSLLIVLEDEPYRQQLESQAILRAKQFSWQRTAQQTYEAYQQALRNHPWALPTLPTIKRLAARSWLRR